MNINNYDKQCGILNVDMGEIKSWLWPHVDTQTFEFIVNDWFKYYRPTLQELFPNKAGVVVQAGGNCGVYPLLCKEFFNCVYTFEPDPLSFFCLTVNCQLPSIYKFNCALGEFTGNVVVNDIMPHNRGMIQTIEINQQGIPMVPIDGFNFISVDLIMLDVEGAELSCLKGAVKTLEKFKPHIIFESNSKEKFEQVKSFLTQFDYKFVKSITNTDALFSVK